MANSGSYIGTLVAISASAPSTYNSAGYAALSWTTVINCTQWGATGDEEEDITVTTLAGRTEHVAGSLDGGAVDFMFRTDIVDPGQVILKSVNNLSTIVSIRLTEPDGKIEYSTGIIGNIRSPEREPGAWKGFGGQFRVNSAVVYV